jgi:hypothetical protein
MDNLADSSRRLLYLLLGFASVFVIIWGIRSSAAIINPILLALVITITVAPLPGKLKQRGMPGWLAPSPAMSMKPLCSSAGGCRPVAEPAGLVGGRGGGCPQTRAGRRGGRQDRAGHRQQRSADLQGVVERMTA